MRVSNPHLSTIRERIYTANLGTLLVLKACGFVIEHRARIIEVTENQLRLRIGANRIQRLLFDCPRHSPVDVTLDICDYPQEDLPEDERMRLPGVSCSQIDVTISPSQSWDHAEFQQFSRRMLWSLRQHFVSP